MLQAAPSEFNDTMLQATSRSAGLWEIRPFESDAGLTVLRLLAAPHHDGLGASLPLPASESAYAPSISPVASRRRSAFLRASPP